MTSQDRKLAAVWFKGCITPEEKEARETLIRNSTAFSTLLLQVLQDKYDTIERKGFKEDDYADSGWTFLQAFRNGKLAEIDEIASLFSFLKER